MAKNTFTLVNLVLLNYRLSFINLVASKQVSYRFKQMLLITDHPDAFHYFAHVAKTCLDSTNPTGVRYSY